MNETHTNFKTLGVSVGLCVCIHGLILWESSDLSGTVHTDLDSSGSTRPFPFPVYGVMETGCVPFLCFLCYNIKMYPAASSKEPMSRTSARTRSAALTLQRLWPDLEPIPVTDAEKWPVENSRFMDTFIIKVFI